MTRRNSQGKSHLKVDDHPSLLHGARLIASALLKPEGHILGSDESPKGTEKPQESSNRRSKGLAAAKRHSGNAQAMYSPPARLHLVCRAARLIRKISHGDVDTGALDGLKVESPVPLIRQLQMRWS